MGCEKLHTDFFTFLEVIHRKNVPVFKKNRLYGDHLGNIRLSYQDKNNDGTITASTEIVEENNYYPFGLKQKGYNTTINGRHHKYMFGGKEQQDELGLNWYDITARNYDPALGRWMNLDPLAEKKYGFTPYNYVQNSPLFRIDPNGLTDFIVNKETGEVTRVGKPNNDQDRVVKTYSRKKKKGQVKYYKRGKKKGQVKVAVSGLKKGILKNGKNLKNQSTVVEVKLDGESRDKKFENSVLKISNYLNVELGGYYFNNKNDGKDYGYLDKFKGNDEKHASAGLNFRTSNMPKLTISQINLKVMWHTHLSIFDDSNRLNPSYLGPNGGDLGTKEKTLEKYSTMKFFIITNPDGFEY